MATTKKTTKEKATEDTQNPVGSLTQEASINMAEEAPKAILALQGTNVLFYPNERMAAKLFKSKSKSFAAIVTEQNENSIDLMVFYDQALPVRKIKHRSQAEKGHSSWDWLGSN